MEDLGFRTVDSCDKVSN